MSAPASALTVRGNFGKDLFPGTPGEFAKHFSESNEGLKLQKEPDGAGFSLRFTSEAESKDDSTSSVMLAGNKRGQLFMAVGGEVEPGATLASTQEDEAGQELFGFIGIKYNKATHEFSLKIKNKNGEERSFPLTVDSVHVNNKENKFCYITYNFSCADPEALALMKQTIAHIKPTVGYWGKIGEKVYGALFGGYKGGSFADFWREKLEKGGLRDFLEQAVAGGQRPEILHKFTPENLELFNSLATPEGLAKVLNDHKLDSSDPKFLSKLIKAVFDPIVGDFSERLDLGLIEAVKAKFAAYVALKIEYFKPELKFLDTEALVRGVDSTHSTAALNLTPAENMLYQKAVTNFDSQCVEIFNSPAGQSAKADLNKAEAEIKQLPKDASREQKDSAQNALKAAQKQASTLIAPIYEAAFKLLTVDETAKAKQQPIAAGMTLAGVVTGPKRNSKEKHEDVPNAVEQPLKTMRVTK